MPMQNEKHELGKVVRSLPQTTGVYLMKDRLGQVIYVGKAKNLKRRVSSYFQGSRRFVRAQPKIAAMVEMVREISIHQTRNETEALLLEGKLIKQYKPRYNTDFTDDKQFLLVQVDLYNSLPRFRLCRNRTSFFACSSLLPPSIKGVMSRGTWFGTGLTFFFRKNGFLPDFR